VTDNELGAAVGQLVMDALNQPSGFPIAVMGHLLDDGTYEFLLGPVFLPQAEPALRDQRETRQFTVTLRPI
jgi:hypothetical protein